MNETTLYRRDGLGQVREATAEEILAAAKSMMNRKVRRGTALSSPRMVRDYLVAKLGNLEHEVFAVLLLDLCGVAVYVETLHYSAALA